MSDRELLQDAAKAAGIEVCFDDLGTPWLDGDKRVWHPIADCADAFRLAVKLRIKFRYHEGLKQALAWVDGTNECEAHASIEECRGDENACCRLAIARVAAEIGRQMK